MKLHRFFGEFDFRNERLFISNPELVGQWRDVLRFEAGSKIILFDGKMNDALARIVSFKKNSAEVEILGVSKNECEPDVRVILYCSILKGEHFEFVVESRLDYWFLRF